MSIARNYLGLDILKNYLTKLRCSHNKDQELFAAQLTFISATVVPLIIFNSLREDHKALALDIVSFAAALIIYRLSFVLNDTFPLKVAVLIIYSFVLTVSNITHDHSALFFLFPLAIMVATFFPRDFLWIGLAISMPPLSVPLIQHDLERQTVMMSVSYTLFSLLLYEFFLTEEHEKNALTQQAEQDGLTGAGNRAALERVLNTPYNSQSTGGPVSVLMFDVDNFKQVNDDYGHPTGDLVLKRFASLVRETSAMSGRNINLYRLGGDEFCVFLFEDAASASDFAASIIEKISRQSLVRETAVSVSVGITELASGETYQDGYLRADEALLEAKEDGKARLVAV